MAEMLTERDVAAKLVVSLPTLRRWRVEGKGPRFLKLGSIVRYRPEELESWLLSRPAGGDSTVRASRA